MSFTNAPSLDLHHPQPQAGQDQVGAPIRSHLHGYTVLIPARIFQNGKNHFHFV